MTDEKRNLYLQYRKKTNTAHNARRHQRYHNDSIYREKVKEMHRRTSKMYLYKLTEEQIKNIWLNQNKTCAVCRMILTSHWSGHIDHCHKTSKVRGILCGLCNMALGGFKDSTKILKQAVQYLETRK